MWSQVKSRKKGGASWITARLPCIIDELRTLAASVYRATFTRFPTVWSTCSVDDVNGRHATDQWV